MSGRSGNAHTALFARVALAARVALLAGGVALLGVAGAGCRGGGSGSDSGPGSGALVLDYEGAHVPTGSDGLALDVLGPDQVQLEISRRGTWVDFPLDLDARDFNGVEIELAFREGGTHHAPRLAWRREGGTFDTAASVSLPPRADPDAPFKVHLEAEPDWKGRITGLRLFAADLPDSRVVLGSIRFARWPLEALLGEGDDGAIRWFTIDSETREVEYVPAGSSRRVEVVVPEGGRIAYAVGVAPWFLEHERADVIFRMSIDAPGAQRREVDRVVLARSDAPRGWVERSASFEGFRVEPGDTVELVLDVSTDGTAGGADVPAFFAHVQPVAVRSPLRPPVLLVSLDTLRADRLGAHGEPRPITPHLDRLAKESVVFRRAKSPAAKTLPSHMSLFTGLHASVHGVVDETDMLPEGWPLLVDRVRSALAYRTAAFTEDAFVSGIFGFRRGFDRYHDGNFHLLGPSEPDRGGDVRATFARFTDFVEKSGDRAWLAFLHTYEPHTPYCPEEDFRGLFRRHDASDRVPLCILDRWVKGIAAKKASGAFDDADLRDVTDTYDEEVRFTDAVLGEVSDRLRALGVLDETILVVFSDHGEDLGDHRDVGRHGHQVYDSVTHVPLMIRWPAGGLTPRVVDDPVGLVDVAPTLLDLLGLAVPEPFQGRSLVSLLRGEGAAPNGDAAREPAFAVSQNLSLFKRTAIESDGYKLIVNDGWNRAKIDPARLTEAHREVFGSRGLPLELYDLRSDPRERRNLVATDASGRPVLRTAEAKDHYDRLRRIRDAVAARSEEVRAAGPARASLAGAASSIIDKLGDLGYLEDPSGGASDEDASDEGASEGEDASEGEGEGEGEDAGGGER